MDQSTRNRLRSAVTQCRRLLEDSVSQEFQGKFGIYAVRKDDVQVDDEARMSHLGAEERAARKDILDHLDHIKARGFKAREALDQLVREVAFTHLNRLCAYKMMEARQVYVGDQRFREAVSRGVNSNGVKFFLAEHPDDERLFTSGQQDVAYRHFLDWLGGLLSEEIGVLFSPHDPANRLYPPQRVLDEVLALINDEALADIWAQDETIGWVYQYFTPKELRDQARKESQAPRNSYELAFRNQFFTPRYVVEFLTDNTLGRIWYEMRKGDTKLKDQCRYMVRRPTEVFQWPQMNTDEHRSEETDDSDSSSDICVHLCSSVAISDLSQEELLKQPVYIPHRPKKDPRELKILDPACGSGHFLLYCFDLLLTIYEEAYADPDLGPALQRDYPTLDALRRDVPRLILAHNLHGIDIDLRASQIAALALWLRCQRAYQDMGLKKDRPKITRSNFVCAEPMPGEQAMLKEFVGQVEPKLLGQLVEVVFDKMKLAGEAGSLLKIEEEIRDAVAGARRQWLSGPISIQRSLFDDDKPVVQQQRFDFSGITDAQFFEQAEAKVVDALRSYAEKAHSGERLQRRLFSEDAVRGFAFVDLCHKRFDVVLMNPPFGTGTARVRSYLEKAYSASKNDLYCMFVASGLTRLVSNGSLGCITSRMGLFLPAMQSWREEVLLSPDVSLKLLADLGYEVLDNAFVETAAYTILRQPAPMEPIRCLSLFSVAEKKTGLRAGFQNDTCSLLLRHQVCSLPGSPFAYWVTHKARSTFSRLESLADNDVTVAVGLITGENERFLRLAWEVPCGSTRWIRYPKGGGYSKYHAEIPLLVDWQDQGEAIKSQTAKKHGSASRFVQNAALYFRDGLTFPNVSLKGFSVRILPAGCIFSHVSQGIFSSTVDRWLLLGVLSSSVAEYLLRMMSPGRKWHSGFLKALPFPQMSSSIEQSIAAAARNCHKAAVTRTALSETSSYFTCPLQPFASESLADWNRRTLDLLARQNSEQEKWQQAIDSICLTAYGLQPDDLVSALTAVAADSSPQDSDEPDDTDAVETFDVCEQVRSLLSYIVGCLFGRWDIRYFSGELPTPEIPDPFARLPNNPPGVLQQSNSISSEQHSGFVVSSDGLLADDPGMPSDLLHGIRETIGRMWVERADAIEKEFCELLGLKELRDYFRKPGKGGFWDDHVSRYTKSRRKAPIYWLLQSSKKNYALWLYYHRLDKDLLFKALVNYVEPKIRLEDSRLETLRTQKAAAGGSGRDAKRLGKDVERQEEFLSELRDFEDKLRRAANLHLEPDLNDGVVLNIAPLWELVPWKEAKSYWEELLEGKYEWSSIGKQLRQKKIIATDEHR